MSKDLALAGASAAAAVGIDLVEFARNGGNLRLTDVVTNACDAAKLAIDAQGGPTDEAENQVYGALTKFLED